MSAVRARHRPPAFASLASEGCRAEAHLGGGGLSARSGSAGQPTVSLASEGCRAEAHLGGGGLSARSGSAGQPNVSLASEGCRAEAHLAEAGSPLAPARQAS